MMPRMMFLRSKRKTTKGGQQSAKTAKLGIVTHDGSASFVKKIKNKTKTFGRKGSSSSKSNSIDTPPEIQRGLTWTNSEDSSIPGDSSVYSASTQNLLELPGSATLLLPMDEYSAKSHATTEFLMIKHNTEIEEKKVEIEVMQDQIVVLNAKCEEKSRDIDSMKEQHKFAIHENIMEMKSMQSRMVIMKNQHEEEIEVLEATLQEKEGEIIDLKEILNCTKADLFEVGSTLIETQHKLHDLSTAWPYKFFV
ncbi:MAG: hypothetical protein SGBAC_012396 [Bacillariaceae sp.]